MSLQGVEKKKVLGRRYEKQDLKLAEVDEDEGDHDRTLAAGIGTLEILDIIRLGFEKMASWRKTDLLGGSWRFRPLEDFKGS